MTKLEIKGTLSGLEIGISSDAREFGYTPRALAEQLRFVAMDSPAARSGRVPG